jgi:ketosteroid isomerase-like protein
MTYDQNLRLAHRAWEAVATGDIDALQEVWADDIAWHVTGTNPWTGTHVGRDAICEYLADVGEIGEAYDTRLEDMLVSEGRVAFVCHVTARRGGKTVETQQILMARIEADKIAEVWTVPLDPSAFDGFFEEPAATAAAQ